MSDKLYDEVIAPKLKEISELCHANGMPFLAICEYEPSQEGLTEYMPNTASLAMRIAAYAARCGGNVDAFYIAISRYCEREGIDTSRSFVLSKFQ